MTSRGWGYVQRNCIELEFWSIDLGTLRGFFFIVCCFMTDFFMDRLING